MRPGSRIERFFAWAKLYYRLKYFKVQGWLTGGYTARVSHLYDTGIIVRGPGSLTFIISDPLWCGQPAGFWLILMPNPFMKGSLW